MATIGSLIVNLEARSERLESELKKAQASLKRTQAEMTKLGTGMGAVERNVTQGFSRMTQGMAGMQAGLAKSAQLFNTLFAAAAAFGGLQLIQQSLALGDAIQDMAEQVDISVEALQRLRFVASQSGGSADLLDRSLNVLNDRLGDASRGSVEAQQKFADLGLRWQDLLRMNAEERFLAIADALGQFPNAADRAARMSGVLGERARAMANTMALGSDGIRAMGTAFQQTGGVLDRFTVEQLAKAHDALTGMATLLQARVAIAVAELVPYILDVANSLERMVPFIIDTTKELTFLTDMEATVVGFFRGMTVEVQTVVDAVKAGIEIFSTLQKVWNSLQPRNLLRGSEMRFLEETLEKTSGLPGAEQAARTAVNRERLRQLQMERAQERMSPTAQLEMGMVPGALKLPAVDITAKRETAVTPPFTIDESAKAAAKRLEDLDKRLREGRQQLEGWATVMQSIGQPIDTTTEKITLLTAAIRDRLAAGVDPASAKIRELGTELQGLQQRATGLEAFQAAVAGQMELGHVPDMTKIVEELDRQLLALDTSIRIFGVSSEDAQRRIDLFRQAMEQAIKDGAVPLNSELQKMDQQLTVLEEKQAWARGIEQGLTAIRDAAEETRGALIGIGESLEEQFEQPRAKLQRVTEELEAVRDVMGESFQPTFERAMQQAQIEFGRTTVLGQGLTIVADGITEAFQQSFEGIVQGTLTVKEAFRNMATSIAASISKILIQKGVEALLNLALGSIAPGPTYAPGGGYGLLAPVRKQQGGLVPGPLGGRPDSVLARVTPGEFVLQRRAVDALGMDLLTRMNQLPSFQTGGPVLPMPRGVMSTQRSKEAPMVVNHTAIIVRSDAEAQAKRQELEAFENQVVTIVSKNVMGGDGSLINRSIQMVHGGRR